MPGSLQVGAGNTCSAVSLWWEVLSRVSQVVSRSVLLKRDGREVIDEGKGGARVGVSVQEFQFEN